MTKKQIKLRGSTALSAFALMAAVTTAIAVAPTVAHAQDYTSGAVVGSVVDQSGRPVAGAEITLRSQAQNQVRTLTSSSSGSFSATGLPAGKYDVTVSAKGYGEYTDTIVVVVAQENRLTLPIASLDAKGEIVVTGARVRQDFTKTTTGLAVDVPQIAAEVALPRSVTALTLLAPGTTRGVAGFGDVPSIGGSSVAENAYYINGLNITNPDTYVGSARVPFDFYQTVDTQTGGYAAEFGRATGGVINATTKSGSNTPMMAIHGNFEASGLHSRAPNIGLASNPSTIGALARDELHQLSVEASGALIKDHLFVYGLYQANTSTSKRANALAGNYETVHGSDPFYGGKVDLYINPTQHLEFTYFDTRETDYISDSAFTANSTFNGGTIGALTGTEKQKLGGQNWVGRYTGNITDFFQVSAAYGISKDANDLAPANSSAYYVVDRRTATTGGVARTISSQPFSSNSIRDTRREFYRIDGDLRFELAGRHHVRFGMDNEDLSELKITQLNGVLPISYDYRNTGVRLTYERLGGAVSGRDRAFYIQDSWEPLNGLTLNLGVRDDEFQQKNLSGERYLNLTGNFAARAGFSFTPNGTSPFKLMGSYGRYYIPPAMNLGFRGKDLYFREYFAYPAGTTAANFPTDPTTGLPLLNLGPALTTLGGSGYSSACPTDISKAPGSPVNGSATCLIFGGGVQDPAAAKAAIGTKATYEDEFILGGRWQVSPLFSIGLTGTYRKLSRVSEDTDFAGALYDAYNCDANPAAAAKQCNFYANNSTYYIWNPGTTTLTVRDWVDPSKTVTLTGLKFPKPKRQYEALVIDWRRKDDGVWSLQGSVTVSRSWGNYEGTVKSDAGNGAQSDAGSTQDFDYIGLTDNSYGLLPNDTTFAFKTFGSYHVTPHFIVGGNVLVQSPQHGSCQGFHPTDPNAAGYGASSFYCAYGPLNANGDYTATRPSGRGNGFKTDWLAQVDLSIRYKLPIKQFHDKFVLRADVFNLFDSHAVLQRYAQHETQKSGNAYTPDPLYLTPTVYEQPRYVRLGFDLAF